MTTATDTKGRTPGVAFIAMDGNYHVVDDAMFPLDTDPTDFVLDSQGNAVVVGSYVQMVSTDPRDRDRVGVIAVVTSVSRAKLYELREPAGFGGGIDGGAWSPSSPTNMVGVKFGRLSTSWSPLKTVRVDMTPEAHRELQLREQFEELSWVDASLASLAGKRAAILMNISRLEAQR